MLPGILAYPRLDITALRLHSTFRTRALRASTTYYALQLRFVRVRRIPYLFAHALHYLLVPPAALTIMVVEQRLSYPPPPPLPRHRVLVPYLPDNAEHLPLHILLHTAIHVTYVISSPNII